ncbi:hypothetical protein BaRGS_00021041, partial [Batillaria attramentaria]
RLTAAEQIAPQELCCTRARNTRRKVWMLALGIGFGVVSSRLQRGNFEVRSGC